MKKSRSVQRSLLSLLMVFGFTVLFILCTYGITVFFNAMLADDASALLRLLCALLGLLLYPGAIIMGAGTVWLSGLITKNDLRWKWPLMLLTGASVFCYGHLITTEQAGMFTLPSFLQLFHQAFAERPDGSGIYLMLYGGSLIFALIYTTQRISFPMLLPKALLYVALPLTLVLLLANYATNIDDGSFWHILSYPALLLMLGCCVLAGFCFAYNCAFNVAGRLRPFFWLLYLLSGVILLFGLFLSVGAFISNLPYHLARELFPTVPSDILRVLDELSAFWSGLGFIALGLPALLSTIAVHGERCPHCGGYAHETSKDLGVDDTYLSDSYSVTESTWTKSRIYSNGWHKDSYDDTKHFFEEYTEKGKEQIFCRYCHRSCGVDTYKRKFRKWIESRDAGHHDEYHFL